MKSSFKYISIHLKLIYPEKLQVMLNPDIEIQ